MSTTVNYKGSTLTTVNNETKTLTTAGTWLEDDIELVDVSGTPKTSADLTVSGATVTAPAGLYVSNASASVASGTTGTPTATKGTVINHQISVTPSVTNTTGYITGGTIDGATITVSASELDSGNKSITSNGTDIDVVGYSTVSVSVSPTLTTKTILADGTYSASSDNVDGYSFISVDVGREDLCYPLDVDFIDYDGRLVYSYTAQDFLALSAMPANPTNPGLVAQGWNWTLSDAQDYVSQYGALVVGQNYTTDNGKTRIYVHVSSCDADVFTLTIYINLVANSSYTVDWGDSSEFTTKTAGNSNAATTAGHKYVNPGDYVISITVTGTARAGYYGANHTFVQSDYKAGIMVKKIEFGNGFNAFCRQPFGNMWNLESVSIPTTMTSIDQTTDLGFFVSRKLKGVVFPSGTTGREKAMFPSNSMASLRYISVPKSMNKIQIGSYPRNLRKFTMYSLEPVNKVSNTVDRTQCPIYLYDTQALTHLIIPGTYENIQTDAIRSTYLRKFTFPASVKYISATAFAYNGYCMEVHLQPTNPPTLQNTNAFGTYDNRIYYVPYSSDHSILQAYQTATNWSTFASQMQEEEPTAEQLAEEET